MNGLDDRGQTYAEAVNRQLTEILEQDLVGVYLHGSAVFDDFTPGRSDIDLMAVCELAISSETKRLIAERLSSEALPCPATGLELHIVRRDSLRELSDRPPFELHVVTDSGAGRDNVVDGLGHAGDADLVMHFAVLRECGRVLSGPSPADLFPAVPRRMMLVALAAELRWARECGSASYQVLNACRAWRYSEERVFCSKLDGARWARTRVGDVSAIDAAIRHRQGWSEIQPDAESTSLLLAHALEQVELALRG